MRQRPGTVYAVEAGGLIKIGFTSGPVAKRIGDLQRMNGSKLTLICTWPGTREDERELHDLFCDHRQHGEWFDLPDGWREQADAIVGGAPDPDLFEMAESLGEEIAMCCGLDAEEIGAALILDALACAGLTLRRGGGESSDTYFQAVLGRRPQ